MSTMDSDLIALAKIKAAEQALAKERAEVEARLVKTMSDKGRKSCGAQVNGENIVGTLVAPERTTIKEEALKKALSAKEWEKVTTRTLDKEKLEAAVVQGIVDANVVAAASEVKATKPYIRITGKVPDKELTSGIGFDGDKVTIVDSSGHVKPAARVARARKATAKKAAAKKRS